MIQLFAAAVRYVRTVVQSLGVAPAVRGESATDRSDARSTTAIGKLARGVAFAMLVAFLATGVQSVFSPIAVATSCGAGEEVCSSSEDSGYDGFCLDIFRFFKFCYDVTRYHPTEPGPYWCLENPDDQGPCPPL